LENWKKRKAKKPQINPNKKTKKPQATKNDMKMRHNPPPAPGN
jgi:hypothetical protein